MQQTLLDFDKPHLFHIQKQKRNQGTLIETGRNRPVSRNQTVILAGLSKSTLLQQGIKKGALHKNYQINQKCAVNCGIKQNGSNKNLNKY